jgi:hypothetical protein
LDPQQKIRPPVVSPHVCLTPALRMLNAEDPLTCAGLTPLALLPSWPASLAPQQYATASSVIAQVCASPLVPRKKESPPATTSGVRFENNGGVPVTPMPSWPASLEPQQNAAPSSPSAHVWRYPDHDGLEDDRAGGRNDPVATPDAEARTSLGPPPGPSVHAVASRPTRSVFPPVGLTVPRRCPPRSRSRSRPSPDSHTDR